MQVVEVEVAVELHEYMARGDCYKYTRDTMADYCTVCNEEIHDRMEQIHTIQYNIIPNNNTHTLCNNNELK